MTEQFKFFFICVSIRLHVYMYTMNKRRPEEGGGSQGTGVTESEL